MARSQTTGSPADLDAIERVRHAHVAALNRGDAEAWAEPFAEDGVQMPPHAHANVGRQMIRTWDCAGAARGATIVPTVGATTAAAPAAGASAVASPPRRQAWSARRSGAWPGSTVRG